MNSFKRLASRHPTLFTLLGLAFVVDIIFLVTTGSLRRDTSYAAGSGEVTTYSTFAAGSVLAVVYFLGLSCLLRFTLARRRLNLGLAWLAISVMFLGWFAIQTALQNGNYKPSFLFILCLVAAFKTMRFQDESQAEDSRDQACDAVSSPLDSKMSSLPQPSKESFVVTAATMNDLPESSTPSKTSSSTVVEKPSNAHQSKKNGLLNLTTTLAALAAFGCLLAVFEMPEDYYKVLRFAVVAACVAVIWSIQKGEASEQKKIIVSVVFGLLAVVFNPILPLEMQRETWAWFDGGAAVAFVIAIISPKWVASFWKENMRGIMLVSFGLGLAVSIPMAAQAILKNKQIAEWESAASRSKFHLYRLGYNDREFLKHRMKQVQEAPSFPGPEFVMMAGLNQAFLGWASRGKIGGDNYLQQCDDLQKEAFEKLIGEKDLFDIIRQAINRCDDGIIKIGKVSFDVAFLVAFPKGVYPDEPEFTRARNDAIALIQEDNSNSLAKQP